MFDQSDGVMTDLTKILKLNLLSIKLELANCTYQDNRSKCEIDLDEKVMPKYG